MPKSQRPGKEKSETGFWPTVTRPFRALGGKTRRLEAVETTQLPGVTDSQIRPVQKRRRVPEQRDTVTIKQETPTWVVLLPRDRLARDSELCTDILHDLDGSIQKYKPAIRRESQSYTPEPKLDVSMTQGTFRQALGRILIDESQKVSVLGRELTEGTLGGHILNTIRASIDTRRKTSNLGTQQVHHLIEVVANSIAPNYDRGGRLFIDEKGQQQARAEIRRIIIGQQKSDKPHPDDFLR